MPEWEDLEVLVTVKAQPVIGMQVGEAVCVAGITTAPPHRWVRLFPVNFRRLPSSRRFDKYDVIRVRARGRPRDTRPESYTPDVDSIERVTHLGSAAGWAARRSIVLPTLSESMCAIRARHAQDGTSLGCFRPASVDAFTWEPAESWDDARRAVAREVAEPHLLDEKRLRPLEQIPYRFRYRYRCAGEAGPGHDQSIVDWELGESFRKWGSVGKDGLQALRTKWLDEMTGPSRDVVLFVGDQHRHPGGFLVLGVFWPPHSEVDDGQAALFD